MAEKIQQLVEEIEGLSVLELNEFIKALEDKFGVSGMMPTMAVAAAPTGGAEAAAGGGKVNVVLTDGGANKIQVIKVLRELNPELGLKEAKDIVDSAPQTVKEGISQEEAEKLKEKFEAAGAKAEIK